MSKKVSSRMRNSNLIGKGAYIVGGVLLSDVAINVIPVVNQQSTMVKGIGQIGLGLLVMPKIVKGQKGKDLATGAIVAGITKIVAPLISGAIPGASASSVGYIGSGQFGSTLMPGVSGNKYARKQQVGALQVR